ncbi:MAG TPA: LytTR family DNA-binding domain-containing protein [Bacteroidia bacterium]|nr:response regulator transcription factor [Bacteroidia bacterium]QQR96316.1 MAG: response regulator transcription factor [Bacteroidota bacterium]MBP7713911.1 response regulator transcription factor [Bacteroidia bacterium]MBP8668092.1 response regulator transcription factor [Bacteroidia bacterium]HOZ81741.1 LytTR family DNA-binding domain-containing protein [Bacteroidia bacterium]
MKFLIVEDEKPNANRLKKIVEQLDSSFQVVDIIDSVAGAVDWFNKNPHPDIVLMDIRLADGLSFDIFSQVKISSAVIFTTAYDEYALQAFKVNGVDYLLKPIEIEELDAAISKVKQNHISASNNPYLDELIGYIKQKEVQYRSRFLFPYKDGYKTINVSDIDLIYSEDKNTHLILQNGSVQIANQTLEEMEEQLDPAVFFRANRQYIININSIESIHNHFNGKLKVVVRKLPQHDILISKEKAPLFKQWLDS